MLSDPEWKTILDRLLGSTEAGALRWSTLDADRVTVHRDEWCYRAQVTQRTEYRITVARGRRDLELTATALWHRPATSEPLVISERSLVSLSPDDHALYDSAARLYHAATRSASGAPQATVAALLEEIDELDRLRAGGVRTGRCEDGGTFGA